MLNTEVPSIRRRRCAARHGTSRWNSEPSRGESSGGGALSPSLRLTYHLLNFPGYEPYCPYTLGPQPRRRRGRGPPPICWKLNGSSIGPGTKGMRVVLDYDREDEGIRGTGLGGPMGDFIIELLDDLGYPGACDRFLPGDPPPWTRVPDGANRVAATSTRQASDFIASLHTCGATFHPIRSGFSVNSVEFYEDQSIVRSSCSSGTRPRRACSGQKVPIARSSSQAPYLWLVNPSTLTFVSERVGNYQQNSVWGVQLNQLWVQ